MPGLFRIKGFPGRPVAIFLLKRLTVAVVVKVDAARDVHMVADHADPALFDLNAGGEYACLYMNVEAAQGAREDVARGIQAILAELASRARDLLADTGPDEMMRDAMDRGGEHGALNDLLTRWATRSPRPLVLLIDEIDALVGDTLISVLRQIRSGYDKRPEHFPHSIVLCGVRDVRDYRIHSGRDKAIITGGSAFNIKAKSLRLSNFDEREVHALLAQHHAETGQPFETAAESLIWESTRGQPWLVNALAYEVCFEMKEGRERSAPITEEMVLQARENLIQRRETHLDQLADKLREERVRRVITPMLTGGSMENILHDDIQYLLDLGLITRTADGLVIANAIYREVIPRELTLITQYNLEPLYQQAWFIRPDGLLDMERLLTAFQDFFREHSEHWVERFDYKEAGPQLLLQAFLQRIINAGGRIDREYALGRRRTDLLVTWPGENGVQKVVIELKILHKSLKQTITEGLDQTAGYMDAAGGEAGHLIIFDRRPGRSWTERIFRKTEVWNGRAITVWGM